MSADLPHAEGLNGAVVRQVKAERAASGMTIEELAEASGIPSRSLSRYLNFDRPLTIEMVAALAAGLNLAPATLMTRATQERQN